MFVIQSELRELKYKLKVYLRIRGIVDTGSNITGLLLANYQHKQNPKERTIQTC